MPNANVIYSLSLDKFYVGACNDNFNDRIEKHTIHSFGNHRFTAVGSSWVLFLSFETPNYPHFIRIESKITAMKRLPYLFRVAIFKGWILT